MRIIAGTFRGRRLLPPAGQATRPITDRVKQSLFDILTPLLDGARVYDCFAGTGSMGLECLSRGAASATFFEADRSAAALLRKNIAQLGVEAMSSVVDADIFRWFKSTDPARDQPPKIDLVFFDPPYRFLRERAEDLRQLAQNVAARMRPDGILVFRHDSADRLDLPPLGVIDQRVYGGMTLELLRPNAPPAGA
jgi:16S rRNA (guanine966-N2)-methyltransferase